jgi:hypothetical protein
MPPASQAAFAAIAPDATSPKVRRACPVNLLVTRTRRPTMSTPRPLYAAAITDAIASGELDQLRKLQALAEEHLNEYGDIGTLLAQLKVEIAKLKA